MIHVPFYYFIRTFGKALGLGSLNIFYFTQHKTLKLKGSRQ